VDYKTNQVSAAHVPSVGRRYELQMYVYALAAERVLGQSPVELVLYFLEPGVEHAVAWNDEARRRASDLIELHLR
jgi:ATP-dependent exoDNAse (exonuclease V) beta subunit